MKLDKFIALSGYTSRRKAKQLIEEKKVIVNGKAGNFTIEIKPEDVVSVEGKVLEVKSFAPIYIAYHKPKGIVCTTEKIEYGKLDITFYRDDVRKELKIANKTDIPFSIENKQVVIIDDVLWTGRTIRAALDALLDFGRPSKVELLVLIDRRFTRQLPIQPDYFGKSIDSLTSEKVKVEWEQLEGADRIWIVPAKQNEI